MQIKKMFEKDIERKIEGVVKVGKDDNEIIYQELDEYVVTTELSKHFSEFFSNYNKGIMNPTDDVGVWISGFFGSGKSHFLKILSYILDSNLIVNGKKPIDFFEKDKKIQDPMVIADMSSATNISTDVILFNIDSKASQSKSKKDTIINVFYKVFNQYLGYSTKPFIADLEKDLVESGKYEEFKQEFKNISNYDWENRRNKFAFIRSKIIQTLVNINHMTREDAETWAKKGEDNVDVTIESFAEEINDYCNSKGINHHIIFLVDEIGQYIADDVNLMLNLQTIVEDLGTKCKGKAWVIVTSQQNIDDITKNIKGDDFSKIQGRFKTRLSLSSSNVDEVIRRRILAKNDVAQEYLEAKYPEVESTLKNILTFDGKVEMKTYKNAEDFANIYPFVPYQFDRVQDVLTSIRQHSAIGKHMADGERSMLDLFQESAKSVQNHEDGKLVPFNIFYNAVENFIDSQHRIVINKATTNELLKPFDVEVLKVLFMIKYVKEIKATSRNITTLMISNINDDRLELNKKVDKSLKRLLEQTLIQKNGEIYSFLTNEEQDINREIKKEIVDSGEVLDKVSERIFSEIYETSKYRVSSHYNFPFNKAIDDREKTSKYDIGIRIITPYYESESTVDNNQSQFEGAGNNLYNVLKRKSDINNEVIVQLPNDFTVFDEIEESLKIAKYLTKHTSDIKPDYRIKKQDEFNDKMDRIKLFLEEAIKNAIIYVKGDKVEIVEKNCQSRLDEAMGKLVDKVYNKLNYMEFVPEKSDILEVLKSNAQETFGTDTNCLNAVNDLEDYIRRQHDKHNNPSLKTVIDQFSNAPYGFRVLDVQWLVATLFVQKRVSLTLNSEELYLKNEGSSKILEYLTKKEFVETILLSKTSKPKSNYIKSVKNILKEVFNQNVQTEDYEKLMDIYKKHNYNKLTVINNYLIEFKSFRHYPGNNILLTAQELFSDVGNKKSISDFYKFVFDKEEDILDISEYLDPVIAFFSGTQKSIFEKSYRIYENYEANKNLIQSEELEEIAKSIKRILDMPNPYSNIKNLPEFNKEFEVKLDSILESQKEIRRNDISSDYETVCKYLTTLELKNKFENDFKLRFDELINKLNRETNISIIKGITDESDNLKENCKNKVQNYINSIKKPIGDEDGGEPTTPITPPITISESNVVIKNIFNSSKIMIKTEEDLYEFLDQLKDKIERELEENDIVNVKF